MHRSNCACCWTHMCYTSMLNVALVIMLHCLFGFIATLDYVQVSFCSCTCDEIGWLVLVYFYCCFSNHPYANIILTNTTAAVHMWIWIVRASCYIPFKQPPTCNHQVRENLLQFDLLSLKGFLISNLTDIFMFEIDMYCFALLKITAKLLVGCTTPMTTNRLCSVPICQQIAAFLSFISNTTVVSTIDIWQICLQAKYCGVQNLPAPLCGYTPDHTTHYQLQVPLSRFLLFETREIDCSSCLQLLIRYLYFFSIFIINFPVKSGSSY